jgi:dolichol kinase
MTLLAVAEAWMRLGHPKPEWTRKLVHVGGGVIGLFLPWLVESPLVVLVLTVSLSTLFVAGGKTGLLKSLHGVERKSRGSEYYPLAIWIIFVLAADRPWLYLDAVIVLATADAFAALVGSKYGVLRYQVEQETKSVEGSIVFFSIAFLAIHLPTLLMTDLPRGVCVLAALLVAMLVTLFEAVSLEGTDNIFVPIAVVFVMQKITTKPISEIAYQNISLLAIILIVALFAWRFHWFNTGGALVVILYTFGTWSLGSRRWTAPVFIAMIALVAIRTWIASRVEAPLRVRILTRALMVPFIFLMAANLTAHYNDYYGPYLAACSAVLAFALWNGGIRLKVLSDWNRTLVAVALGVLAVVIVAAPMWVLYRHTMLVSLAAIAVVVPLVNLANAKITRPDGEWHGSAFILAAFAGLLVVALQYFEVIAPWVSTR